MKIKYITFMVFTALLSGCVVLHGYRPDVRQGNMISPQKVKQLQVGMTKDKVAKIMGSPLINDTFNSNRWNYAYTYHKPGHKLTKKTVVVYFQSGRVAKIKKQLGMVHK